MRFEDVHAAPHAKGAVMPPALNPRVSTTGNCCRKRREGWHQAKHRVWTISLAAV